MDDNDDDKERGSGGSFQLTTVTHSNSASTADKSTLLFADKYRPQSLAELDFGHTVNHQLEKLAKTDTIPHLILEGNRGVGKKTRALLFLKEKFGEGVMSIKNCVVQCKVSSSKTIDLQILISQYHYQFNPSIHGVYDRVILQQFVEKVIKFGSVATKLPYRIVIIEDADKLTQEAQQSLRRTLEARIQSCRFIFLVNREDYLIDPLYSRCVKLRMAAPENVEIRTMIDKILTAENVSIADQVIEQLISNSSRNMNIILNYLQKVVTKYSNITVFDVNLVDEIQRSIVQIVDLMVGGGELTVINDIRVILYDLLVHCVSPTEILRCIFKELVVNRRIELETVFNIIRISAEFDTSLRLGSKAMYHLEAFCLQLFREIKLLMLHKQQKQENPSLKTREIQITKKGGGT